MNELYLICSAIATQEGYFNPHDTPPKRNNNPGDLRASPLPRKKDGAGFVVFSSASEGVAALYQQVLLYALRGFTLRQLIEVYCPRSGADGGNNTDLYLADVQKWTKLNLDTRIYTYLKLDNAYNFKS